MIGNIKGLQDPYRNPTTQKGFAEKWGTKSGHALPALPMAPRLGFEQATVGNATGFVVKSRGTCREAREYKDDVMKIGKPLRF